MPAGAGGESWSSRGTTAWESHGSSGGISRISLQPGQKLRMRRGGTCALAGAGSRSGCCRGIIGPAWGFRGISRGTMREVDEKKLDVRCDFQRRFLSHHEVLKASLLGFVPIVATARRLGQPDFADLSPLGMRPCRALPRWGRECSNPRLVRGRRRIRAGRPSPWRAPRGPSRHVEREAKTPW